MSLQEPVEIWTTNPEPLHKLAVGTLFVGDGGLPELTFDEDFYFPSPHYTLASLPACWVLMPPKGGQRGVLLEAWREVESDRHGCSVQR